MRLSLSLVGVLLTPCRGAGVAAGTVAAAVCTSGSVSPSSGAGARTGAAAAAAGPALDASPSPRTPPGCCAPAPTLEGTIWGVPSSTNTCPSPCLRRVPIVPPPSVRTACAASASASSLVADFLATPPPVPSSVFAGFSADTFPAADARTACSAAPLMHASSATPSTASSPAPAELMAMVVGIPTACVST